MTAPATILRGIIHGRTIELDRDIGLADGEVVQVSIDSKSVSSLTSEEALAAIDATAGACADEVDEWDEFDRWYREQRQQDRPSIEDDE